MKLTKLHLINYRGAKDLIIDLDPKLNVFIGTNGTGKSTILDSVALMLSWVIKRIENPKSSGSSIPDLSITNQQNFALIEMTVENESEPLTWKLHKVRPGRISKESSDLTQLKQYTESVRRQLDQQQVTNLTLFAYYPVNRAVSMLDIPARIRIKHEFSPLAAYDNALNSEANFRIFFEWFREREDIENENFRLIKQNEQTSLFPEDDLNKTREQLTYPDLQLEAVRQTIEKFLPGFTRPRVRRNPLRMEITKDQQVLRIEQLSDGKKCLMAMVGDLARRLVILNPGHPQPLTAPAIILIDEIDLHLHPQWQRRIIPTLLATFPNCQFLITTHSPHVVTHVQPENLQILEQTEAGIEVNSASESYGKTAERILEDLMGLTTTRPTEIEQSLQQIYQCIDNAELATAKQKLKQLRQNIKSITDTELTRLELIIRREERSAL